MKKIKVGKRLGLARPEDQLANAIMAFWDNDDVVAKFDPEANTITITVGDAEILAAMKKYIKAEAKVSATTVKLFVAATTPDIEQEAAGITFADLEEELNALFKGVFSYLYLEVVEGEDPMPTVNFALFRNDVMLQFFADDLSNPVGFKTVVPADFACALIDLQGQASITTEAFAD